MAEYVDLQVKAPWAKGPDLDAVAHSRHCTLFELLRHYAYSIVARERESGSYEGFVRLLEAHCINVSRRVSQATGKAEELRWPSLQATAKSVARWTWEKYTGGGQCHRGVMQLDKALPLAERQRQAAARTHALRAQATESKVRAACRQLRADGQALALAAVARLAGVTRQTVATYKHLLTEAIQPVAALPQRADSGTDGAVKNAVHQVPAPRGTKEGSSGSGAVMRRVNGLGPEPAS